MTMVPASARQIGAARKLLDMSQVDVATKVNLCRRTILKIEKGGKAKPENVFAVCKMLEESGIEFMGDDGVRLRKSAFRRYYGPESCEMYFSDVKVALMETGSDFYCFIRSTDIFTAQSGANGRTNLERLKEVSKITSVKCLITPGVKLPFPPPCEIRIMAENEFMPFTSHCAYGDMLAHILLDARAGEFEIGSTQQKSMADGFKAFIKSNWQNAKPFYEVSPT